MQAHMEKRTVRVMVRLAPGKAVAPDEVRFTAEEKAAVDRAMGQAKYSAVSTFIRELAVAAAQSTVTRGKLDDFQVVKTAANGCGLPLGEWVRLVVLGALEFTPLEVHLSAGRAFMDQTRA